MSDLQTGVDQLLEAVREAPRDAARWRALLAALVDAGQHAAARRALARAKTCLPASTALSDLEARLASELAVRHIRRGEAREALACLDACGESPGGLPRALALRGLALNRLGRFDAADAAYRDALRSAPDDVGVLSDLGSNLNDAGRFGEAEGPLRHALGLDAGALAARVNLAISLQGQDRLREMADVLARLPADIPDVPVLLVTLGTLQARARRPHEALALLERAAALDPGAGEAWQAAGIACQLLGRLDDAIHRFRRAIALWLAGQWPAAPRSAVAGVASEPDAAESVRAPAPTADDLFRGPAHRALLDAGRLLDDAGIPFFLAFGTLLGAVREGDLLAFDKDVDLGLWWDSDRTQVMQALTGGGCFRLSGESELGGEPERQRQISLRHGPSGVCVDLDFFRLEGEHAVCGIHHLPVPLECRLHRFELGEMALIGRRWRVPDPPERFLEDMYGPDWRIPQPFFDSVLSARCIVPGSVQVALCFGYSRLVVRLRSGQLERAAAYCRQLLARRPDPLLEQVLAQLAGGRPAEAA